MKHRTVKENYVHWSGHRLKAEERRHIQEHLDGCDECRIHYEKMAVLLDDTDPVLLPRLTPDPFLPARIRALAGSRAPVPVRRRALGWLRASLAGVLLMVAASAGVLLGHGLSNGSTSATAEGVDLAQEYYEAFSPSDFSGVWENVLNDTGRNGESNRSGVAGEKQ
jgi:predicted anti-sigma-YlaC factor YlaD